MFQFFPILLLRSVTSFLSSDETLPTLFIGGLLQPENVTDRFSGGLQRACLARGGAGKLSRKVPRIFSAELSKRAIVGKSLLVLVDDVFVFAGPHPIPPSV